MFPLGLMRDFRAAAGIMSSGRWTGAFQAQVRHGSAEIRL